MSGDVYVGVALLIATLCTAYSIGHTGYDGRKGGAISGFITWVIVLGILMWLYDRLREIHFIN